MIETAVQCKLISVYPKASPEIYIKKIQKRGYRVEKLSDCIFAIYFDFVRMRLKDVVSELDFNYISQFMLTKNKIYYLLSFLSEMQVGFSINWTEQLIGDDLYEYREIKFQIENNKIDNKEYIKKLIYFIEMIENEELIYVKDITFSKNGKRFVVTQSGIIYHDNTEVETLKKIAEKIGSR